MNYFTKQKIYLAWNGYYNYNKEKLESVVPEDAGVYKLSVLLKNGNLRVFYVGQSENLKERLYDHLQDYESNDCIKGKVGKYICKFKFALLSKEDERDGAERALFLYYNPECNNEYAIPSGPDLEINPD